jgi:glycosyltransferase involved in cell wall biosynthesis
VAAARNTGLARATGDVLAFLDADDAWHPRKLERQVEVLSRESDVGLLGTRLSPWPGEFPPDAELTTGQIAEVPLARLLVCNSLATSSIVVRRAVLDEAGPFDTELFGPEDYDLWLRCARVAKAAVLDEPLTGYRDTSGSLGKQAETMRRGLLRIHAKLDAAGAWPSRWLRRKCRAHVDYTTGYMYFAAGQPARAAGLLVQSLARYPLPMRPGEVRYRWARLRLFARSAWSSCAGRS